MAAVALAVGGLFEGAEHERCIRLAAVPAPRGLAGDQPARLGRDLARLARREPAAQRRRRDLERRAAARSAARSAAGRAGRGPGRSPAPACAPAAGRPARWRGSSAARSAGATRSGRRRGRRSRWPPASKRNSGSKDSTSRLVAPRLLAQRRRRLAGDRQRLGDRLGRLGPPGEDDVELVVVEPRVGADPAAVEARRAAARRPAPSSISAVTASRSTPGARLHASLAQRVRQHRLDRARRRRCCCRGAAPRGRAASPGARGRRRRRCGSRAGPPSPSRRAETASSKSRAVAGSTVKVGSAGQVAARRRPRLGGGRRPPGLGLERGAEAAPGRAPRAAAPRPRRARPRLGPPAPAAARCRARWSPSPPLHRSRLPAPAGRVRRPSSRAVCGRSSAPADVGMDPLAGQVDRRPA